MDGKAGSYLPRQMGDALQTVVDVQLRTHENEPEGVHAAGQRAFTAQSDNITLSKSYRNLLPMPQEYQVRCFSLIKELAANPTTSGKSSRDR